MDQEKFDKAVDIKSDIEDCIEKIDEINSFIPYNINRVIKIWTPDGDVGLFSFTQQYITELLQAELAIVQSELKELQAEFDQL